MNFKACSLCKVEKPLSKEFFKHGKRYSGGWRPICKECARQNQINYRKRNKEELIQKRRNHYLSIPDKVKRWDVLSKANKKKFFELNPEKHAVAKAKRNRKHMERYHSDPIYKLRHRLRGRIYTAIKKKYRKLRFEEYLGCSLQDLKIYLEDRWLPGMSWGNHGSAWHIDHIKPLASFDLADPDQLRIAARFSNLQPLWGKDNQRKSAKLNWSR